MKRLFLSLVLLFAASSALAVPVTMNFSASGFQNSGAQFPGFNGPISGSISWNANDPDDPVTALTNISFNLYGHAFTLGEIGFQNFGTSTVLGATARGINAVVGDGAFDDFLMVFDRSSGQITAFAYSLLGKGNAIWWEPTQTDVRISSGDVPEPSSIALLALAMVGLAAVTRKQAR